MYACAKWQHLIYVFIRWIVVKSLIFRGKSTNFWVKCMEKNKKICNWCKIFHPCPPPLHPKSYPQPQGVGVIIIICYSGKLLRIHFFFMRIWIQILDPPWWKWIRIQVRYLVWEQTFFLYFPPWVRITICLLIRMNQQNICLCRLKWGTETDWSME